MQWQWMWDNIRAISSAAEIKIFTRNQKSLLLQHFPSTPYATLLGLRQSFTLLILMHQLMWLHYPGEYNMKGQMPLTQILHNLNCITRIGILFPTKWYEFKFTKKLANSKWIIQAAADFNKTSHPHSLLFAPKGNVSGSSEKNAPEPRPSSTQSA